MGAFVSILNFSSPDSTLTHNINHTLDPDLCVKDTGRLFLTKVGVATVGHGLAELDNDLNTGQLLYHSMQSFVKGDLRCLVTVLYSNFKHFNGQQALLFSIHTTVVVCCFVLFRVEQHGAFESVFIAGH